MANNALIVLVNILVNILTELSSSPRVRSSSHAPTFKSKRSNTRLNMNIIPDIIPLPSTILSTASSDIQSMSDDVYGPVFLGGISLMFAGIASAWVVGNIIPDEAWETLANEGFETLEDVVKEDDEENKERRGEEEIKEKGMFDDY